MIEKILIASKTKGLRQESLEQMCGLAANRISKWKNNQGEPTARQILRIADTLGLPVRYLIDDSMEEPTPELELCPEDREILDMVAKLGHDRAMARLLLLPEPQTEQPLTFPQPGQQGAATVVPQWDPVTGLPVVPRRQGKTGA